MKIHVRNVMNGLVGLSGHQRRGRGQRCRGGAHEDPQNAQKSTSTGVPPTTLKNIEKKSMVLTRHKIRIGKLGKGIRIITYGHFCML